MPKAKKKTKKAVAKTKRSVTCGKCKETGHNARTCPTSATTAVAVATPVTSPIPAVREIPKAPARRKSTVPARPAPTAGNTSENNHAPYRCEKCTQVAILVSVRVTDHQKTFHNDGKTVYMADLRCERCFNKPPAELILKWGCSPGEVVPVASA